ncbi:MAG: nucleoside kinase [Bacteroides sp.]|nr:nucleoside kinase [Bacteroides sp.]MCM1084705.1 nucleoside kinase [Bacteroides sp.]
MSQIEIICKNTGIRKEYPMGVTLAQIAADQNIVLQDDILGAKCNNKLRELSYEIYKPKTVEFIDIHDPIGYAMYLRSMVFILFKAVRDLWPECTLKVEHALPLGSYCEIIGRTGPLTLDMVLRLRHRMQEIVDARIPFQRNVLPTDEAIEIFKKNRLNEKGLLFQTRSELYTTVYTLDDVSNYFYGYLVPDTGYIKRFHIDRYFGNGLIAMRPDVQELISKDAKLFIKTLIKDAINGGSKLFKTYQEQKEWLDIMGVPYVGNLNKAVLEEGPGRIIKISEALQEKKIANIADMVVQDPDRRIVLISGPSSSGKTSFCKRLSIQLQVLGYQTAEISLDDYFVDREKTPLDENGEYDFECIEAIDRDFFNQQLDQMLEAKKDTEIKLPTYDFKDGKRKFLGKKVKVTPKTILIIEGIHGLNPALTTIDSRYTFKVFVSALTHISIDTQNPVSSTDNRLIRRIVRDNNFRGNTALDTLKRWASVRRGENQNIFPYQENADVMFNSALLFELGVLKKHAEPLLREIPESSEHYGEAHRLLKFLSYFVSIDEKEIPPTSILREFLGGSSFMY